MRTTQRPFLRALGLSLLLLTVGLLSPKSAHADPHGVFFTVVGQQQLFFNILAALNQADYVEPLQLRQQLSQGRDTAGYAPSKHSTLTATQTDLADVLTRSVSLEGQDVRTQERSDEYAREVVRQRRVAELIKKLCQEAFGAKDCTGDVKPQPLAGKFAPLTGKEQSFVQDPVTREQLPFILGVLGALSSGTDAHRKFAEDLIKEAARGGAVLPFEYSPVVAAWRKSASGEAVEALDRALAWKAASFLSTELDPTFWDQITLENGQAEVNIAPNDSPELKSEKFFGALNELLAIPNTLEEIAQEAEKRVALQLNSTVVDGAVPDLEYVPEYNRDGSLGRLNTIVKSPANVKVGLQQQLLILLTQLEGSPDFVDPTQIDNPAGEPAVDREGKDPLRIGTALEPFQQADIVEKGLLPNSGVVTRPGLGRSFLKEFIGGCLKKFCIAINPPPQS